MELKIILASALVLLILIKPVRRLLRPFLRTLLAGAGLYLLSLALPSGLTPGVNLINSSMIGFLGIPGIVSVFGLHFLL